MKKKFRQLIIAALVLLAVLCLVFIFSNSLKDGVESGEQSMAVKRLLLAVADFFGIKGDIEVSVLRNLAHVAEFAMLGLLIGILLIYFARRKYPISQLRYAVVFMVSIGSGVFFAVVDELLQLGSAGRACELSDVFLDTAGIFLGNLFASFCYFVFVKIKKFINKAKKEKIAKNT